MINIFSIVKRFVRTFYDRNGAFIMHLRRQGAKVGANVQIVDGFGFLYEPWFANLIEIQDGVVISAGVRIVCHDSSYANIFSDLPVKFGGIFIGNNSYVGVNSILLPGISIGECSLIGAGSLVNKNVPPYSIAVGNPARVIGDSRDGLKRYKSGINMPLNESIFYLDLGGSDKQMRKKYGSTYLEEIMTRYEKYYSSMK